MRINFTLLSFFGMFIAGVNSDAATTLRGKQADQYASGAEQIILNDNSSIPSFIIFREESRPQTGAPDLWLKLSFGMEAEFGLQLLSTGPDQIGFIHYRYQQTYKGIPLDATMWNVHTRNNVIVSMNGMLLSHLKGATTPVIDEASALNNALKEVPAEIYKWQIPEEEALLKKISNNPDATYYPKAELVYGWNSRSSAKPDYKLTYRFDIYAHHPLARKYVFVDAVNGNIVDVQDRIRESNTNATAVTAYVGNQTIGTDSVSPTLYRLREAGRGAGLGMETYNLGTGTNYGAAIDFTDADNFWNNVNAAKDQYATDAHFAAEKTYDYYYTRYGRNSIDNAGLKLVSYVHYSSNYVNAFWDGTRMTYGDGNATYTPLVSLDIGGHEITHGLTEYTANLVYANEPGALNESFSDCFGTSVEWFADSAHANWLIGEKIGTAFRSHANPNLYGDPDTYLGTNWYTGTGDNGGVHTNSGVQNFWFYLLSVGGSGVNDIGNAFSVTGIGINKAAAITFRSLTIYLTSTSQYADARTYSIQAAADLYGPCSPEVTATASAWYAVGVGNPAGSTTSIAAGSVTSFCFGGSVVLTATAPIGSTYEWYRNGVLIPGANSFSYSVTQAGSYYAVTNACSVTLTSNAIPVTVLQEFPTVNPAGSVTTCNEVLLTAQNRGGYNVQWNKNGIPISGAHDTTYTAFQTGNYSFTLSATIIPGAIATNATSVSVPDNTCTPPAYSTITVSGLPASVPTGGISVMIHVTHTWDGDLDLILEAPNGDLLGLTNMVGGSGDNFTNTVFSDTGSSNINAASAPFTGSFKPWASVFSSCITTTKTSFGAIGGGTMNPNGDWKFRIYDRGPADIGTIDSWTITFPPRTIPTPNCGPIVSPTTSVSIGTSATASITPVSNVYHEWTQKNNFPNAARAYGASASIGGKGYFGYGDNSFHSDWWEYNAATDSWTQKASGPVGLYSCASFSIGTKAFIVGGYTGAYVNTVYEWNQVSNSWSAQNPFGGGARAYMASCVSGGKGYIICGGTGAGSNADIWEYDPGADSWTLKNTVPGGGVSGRNKMSAFALGNKVYFGLGQTCGSPCTPVYVNDWFEYNPSGNTVTQKNNFPGSGREGACSFTIGDKGYVAFGNSGSTWLNDLWEYEGTFDTWTQRIGYSGAGRSGASAFVINNAVYVISGNTAGGAVTDVLQMKPVSHICTNTPASVSLQASSGTSYLWNTGATTQSITGVPNGDYSVTVTNTGCSAVAYSSIAIFPVPVASISNGGPTTFCSGGSVTLTSSAGNAYLWSNGETTSAIHASLPGAYTVTVTSTGGCTNSSSPVNITTIPSPGVTVTSATPFGICPGNSVALSATGYAMVPFAPVSGSGTSLTLGDDELSTVLPIGFNFTFYGNVYNLFLISSNGYLSFPGTTSAGCCIGQLIPSVTWPNNVIAFAWYDLYPPGGGTIEYFTTGIAPSRKLVVNFINIPHYPAGNLITSQVVLFETTNDIEIHTTTMPTNGGQHTMGLENSAGTLAMPVQGRNSTSWSATNEGIRFSPVVNSYLWNTGATTPAISTTIPGTYTVTVSNSTGCSSTASATVIQNVVPTAFITPSSPATFCTGGNVTITASGGATYSWNTGATTSAITVSAAGTYTATVTNSSGCTGTASVTVTSSPIPSPAISPGGTTTICSGSTATLTATPPAASYMWSNGATTQSIVVSTAGTYSVTETSTAGCTGTSSATTVQVNTCFASLNVHLLIEGYYKNTGNMVAVVDGIGQPAVCDTMIVDLHTAISPYNTAYSRKGVIDTAGNGSFIFPDSTIGHSWYIAVRHRSSLETWSKNPLLFGPVNNYDFANSLAQAYDDGVKPPMKSVAGGKFAFYSGDVNQDGTVDILDMSTTDNDATVFAFGYNASDLNGDGSTDILDMTIVDNNANLFLFYARPY